MGHKNEYGCLMAMVSPTAGQSIIKFGKSLIRDSDLYIKQGEEYGRETEPHVTIRFGFTPDLKDAEIKKVIADVKSFDITSSGISIFENEDFDVVKFDINKSGPLMELHERSTVYPHVNSFPTYHPHLTVAYVRKGSFKNKITDKHLLFKINRLKYSGMNGDKRWYTI